MVRLQLNLGFLFSSPIFHREPVDVREGGSIESESEGESECGEDLISFPSIIPATEKRSIFATATAALRRSLPMCSHGAGEGASGTCMDIGWPSNVQHVSHVTFDRIDGFLGVPAEFHLEIPKQVPSASGRIFGVSAESMQCSYDGRRNSVPTILLSIQQHLYAQGGLKEEGIFRINAESEQEMLAREELNKGVVPHGIDLHCLAGLIKAWFRELPNGVLDSIPPDLLMHSNAKGECSKLVGMLPPTEAALLRWAIDLMADVAEHQHYNKMNARNIATVFAPNLTQMTDPLIALIHTVQVMNFLHALIMKTLHEREQAVAEDSCRGLHVETCSLDSSNLTPFHNSLSTADGSDSDAYASFRSFENRSEINDCDFISGRSSPTTSDSGECKNRYGNFNAEGLLNRLSLRKGVQKLCRRSVLFLNRSTKKTAGTDFVISGECP